MPNEILFERDPEMGTVTTFLYDESNDTFTLREQQDVSAIVEINQYLAKMGRPKGDVKRVGSIPLTVPVPGSTTPTTQSFGRTVG